MCFLPKEVKCPSCECRTEQRVSGHPGQSFPEVVSFRFDLHIPVTAHSPSQIGVWALFCPMGYVLWRVLFKGKKAQTKKPLVLPSDQSAWSIAGDGPSPGMLRHGSSGLGTCFPRWGNTVYQKQNPKLLKRQKHLYFKKTLSSSELKFMLLHGKLLVCPGMG